MRKIYIIPLIFAGVIILAASVKIGSAAVGRKTGPIYGTPPPQALQHIISHTPVSATAPTSCEFLGNPKVTVGMEISQKYGEIRECFLFDNDWIILTEGVKEPDGTRQSGVVAVYRCEPADSTCLNNQGDHPMTGWQIYQPPCPGELSVGFGVLPGKFRVMGTCANYFDVTTGTFTNN